MKSGAIYCSAQLRGKKVRELVFVTIVCSVVLV